MPVFQIKSLITRALIMFCCISAGNAMNAKVAKAEGGAQGNMAKLCANCHESQAGVMMGFLENIALKSKTIQMDLLSHKDVVSFSADTKVKYVDSLADIRNYRGKGFQINFIEQNGEKLATEIIRFDILKVIASGEYKVDNLTLEQFLRKRENAAAVVYDVRPPMKYKEAHIAGAKPLPAPAFEKFKDKLPRDKSTPILLYGVGGCLSPTVAFKLKQMGYNDVGIFTAGFPAWTRTHYAHTTPDWLKNAITTEIPHVLIDLRDASEVEKGHIQGAVNLPPAVLTDHKEDFPTQKNAPLVLYGPEPEKAAEMLVSWGYRQTRILPVTFEQWQKDKNPIRTGKANDNIVYVPKPKPGTVSMADFVKIASHPTAADLLIDVRNPDEVTEGRIANSINIPVEQIGREASSLPRDKAIYLFCQTGTRAEMAHTILQKQGKESSYLDALVTIEADGTFEVEEK